MGMFLKKRELIQRILANREAEVLKVICFGWFCWELRGPGQRMLHEEPELPSSIL